MYKRWVEYTPHGSIRQDQIRQSLARRLQRRAVVEGKISLPAVPGMVDEYVEMCAASFAAVGCAFNDEQLAHLRTVLHNQATVAYQQSPRSNIVITYNSPIGTMLSYNVNTEWWTVEGAYNNWVATREPPLFGTEPDARVWALAGEAHDPRTFPILDIGAGTGRNTLALARRGHPVDAVEPTSSFAEIIRNEASRDNLQVRVIERDAFKATDELRKDYQLILLSEVVSDFRTTAELRGVCEIAGKCLAPGGRLVFNIFLPKPGYARDDAARALGEQCYTSIFTSEEMIAAAAGLGLTLVGDDSVYEYEQANLPEGAWPPTSWYADWVSGRDTFDLPREECPIELRWLVYQKAL